MTITLGPGQYQIGSVRFGRNTMLPLETNDNQGYGVNSTDYQLPRSDEMRFGVDSLQPGSIAFTFGILDNRVLTSMSGMTGVSSISGIRSAQDMLEDLHTEWRIDDIRKEYGFVVPLWMHRQGLTVRVYGRPRKFASDLRSHKSEYRKAVAEFQRVDTLCYTEDEYSVVATPSAEGTTTQNIVRTLGRGRTWMKIYIQGPINHPKIKIGSLPLIDINHNIAADEIVEINSYPWSRRVVDNNGLNIAPLLIGNSPYLDELWLYAQATTPVGFSGSSTTGATKMSVLWREAFNTL